MILNFFIFHQSGPCIFKCEYLKGTEIDEQLISGFLTALSSFAQEAFLDGLQRIHLASGRRLIYGYNKEYGLLAAALSQNKDHPKLVEELVNQLMDEFTKKYKSHLNPIDPSPSIYEDFKTIVDRHVLKRIRTRDNITSIFSIGLALILGILTYALSTWLPTGGFLLALATIPSIPAGYIAGERWIGALSGFVGTIPILSVLITAGIPLNQLLSIIQLIVPLAVVMGAMVGYFVERKFLFPIKSSKRAV